MDSCLLGDLVASLPALTDLQFDFEWCATPLCALLSFKCIYNQTACVCGDTHKLI